MMRQKIIKIYVAGLFILLGIAVVLLLLWGSFGFTRRLTEMTFDGPVRTIELPQVRKVTIRQTDMNVINGNHDSDDVWFKIKGDSTLSTPQLRMPVGMDRIVKWSTTEDGTLEITLDVSEVETPELEVNASAPAVLALPPRTEWHISMPDPVPAMGTAVIESLDVPVLRIDFYSGLSLSYVKADTLYMTLTTPSEAMRHIIDVKEPGFARYRPEMYRPVTLVGPTVGAMTLDVQDPGEWPKVRLEVSRMQTGRGERRRMIGEIDSLYVKASGEIADKELVLCYNGMLPRVMDFEPGIANSVEITTKDDYTLVTEPENVKNHENDN